MNNQEETLTLGQELKRRREARGIDLHDISNATRVAVRFLRAIEQDDYKALPGGLFTRSFIRTYARYVGLDEEEAIARYYEQTGQTRDDLKRFGLTADAAESAKTSFWTSIMVAFSILAVLALGGWAGWHYWRRAVKPTAQPSTVSQTEQPISQPAPQPPAQLPAQSPAPALDQPQAPTAPPSAEPTAATPGTLAQGAPAQAEVLPSRRLEVRLEATGKCWISVLADEETKPTQEMLNPGDVRTFSPKKKLKLTVGSVPSLKITLNGQLAEIPSAGLVARDVVITPENAQQFIKR